MGERTEAIVAPVARTEPAHTLDVDLLVVPVTARGPLATGLASLTQVPRSADHPIARRPGDVFAASGVVLVDPPQGGISLPDHARAVGARLGRCHPTVRSIVTTFHLLGDDAAVGFLEGLSQGRYRYRDPVPGSVVFAETPDPPRLTAILAQAAVREEAVTWVRRLVDTPASSLTPQGMADAARSLADLDGVTVQIWDEKRCVQERFAGVVAVGGGSGKPPRVIHADYRGPGCADRPDLVLVGKGITFDSGGLSMKGATAMLGMKADMAGGATVLGALRALARNRTPGVHVLAVVPCAENLPGPGALLPGDVITHRNGRTTEVVNTDCEGRLVLADALAYAAEHHPGRIVDVATLTYATIAALGVDITSVLGNDDDLRDSLIEAGRRAGEPIWPLPLWQPYRRLLTSTLADSRNEESLDQAAAITAALFLQDFVAGVPWAHLDIGGTGYLDDDITDGPRAGATAAIVRTLIHLVQNIRHAPAIHDTPERS